MTVAEKFIVFNQPDLGAEEMTAVLNVMRSGWIGTGKVCKQFEEEFADFMGGGYAVGVSSCTIGLQLALKSLGIGLHDKVIVPALTFAATFNSVLAVGATPVLVDVNQTGCIDVNIVNKSVDNLTKAVIPVHYSGTPAKISHIKQELKIIEDCAHAFGSNLTTRNDFRVFSFYANKTITSGEGGMVLTKDKKLAEEVRVLSAQGLSLGAWARYGHGPIKKYEVEKVGLKGNLPDILAAIGLTQLRRWPEMKQKRMLIWKVYEKAFGTKGPGHSTHFYPLLIAHRDKVRELLHERGIGTGVHYKPLHLEPAYEFLGYERGDFPNAEEYGDTELSLPVSSTMSEGDAERIVNAIQEIKGTLN